MNNQKKNQPQKNQDPLIGTILSDFRIDSLIGAGGMGSVYKATQQSLDKTVAIKVLSPELVREPGFVERFIDEARLAAFLDHQNIVRIITAGEDNHIYYIAMEYVGGQDLREYLKEKGRLKELEAAFIFRETAKALSLAHENNIIHRDVKTDNIMITPRGEIKLADFGIAKAFADSSRTRAAHATQTGMTIGTLKYMSPEQERGEELDGRSDLYSLGIVIYESLAGDVPSFHTKQRAAFSKKMQKILSRLLAKKREDRYGFASELINVLETTYPEIRGAATLDQVGKVRLPVTKTVSQSRALFILAGILTAAVILGIVGYRYWGAANMGTLAVESSPDKAAVFIDGTLVGQTPLKSKVLSGEHEIKVGKEGFKPFVQKVRIARLKTTEKKITLKPVRGSITIVTDPPGATVLMNDMEVGETPLELNEMSLGDYRIELIKEGFLPYSGEQHLAGDQTVKLEHALVPDPIFVYLEEGQKSFSDGEYELCISNMKQVLEHDPENQVAKEYTSRCENKIKMALTERVKKKVREGRAFLKKGKYDSCVLKAKEALEINPQSRSAWVLQQECQEAKKEALEKMKKGLESAEPTVRKKN